jgi:hypothetical protein
MEISKKTYPRLEEIDEPTLDTKTAAHFLGLEENTLRKWHCYEVGLLQPIKIGNKLRWPIGEIRKLLRCE